MFAQVNVEILGIVENMSHFTCPHCHQEIDIFSKGGAERTATQFNIPFLARLSWCPLSAKAATADCPSRLPSKSRRPLSSTLLLRN